MGPLSLLKSGLRRLLGAALMRVRASAPSPAAIPEPLDPQLLRETATMLEAMLLEVDELARSLPSDARPIGVAARELVERSLAECRKPQADAARLAKDMEQVSHLALAMRERLLLNPRDRAPTMPC